MTPKRYETAILFDPELPEDQRKEFLGKLSGVIASYQGEVLPYQVSWKPAGLSGQALVRWLLYGAGTEPLIGVWNVFHTQQQF